MVIQKLSFLVLPVLVTGIACSSGSNSDVAIDTNMSTSTGNTDNGAIDTETPTSTGNTGNTGNGAIDTEMSTSTGNTDNGAVDTEMPTSTGNTDNGAIDTEMPTSTGNTDNGVDNNEQSSMPGVAPNILFLIADDQGLDASAQYALSSDVPNTPVIDALAARGIVFDNAWATPSCTTTRGSLISGQHGVNSGVTTTPSLMDANTLTLQRFLSNTDAGYDYATAVIGKWHLAGGNTSGQLTHPNDSGVDYYAGNISGTLDSYFDWPLNINGSSSNATTYHTSKITDLAIDWVQEQSEPWFLWMAYVSPHSPFHLPPDHLHTQNLSGTAEDIEANTRAYYLAAIEAMDTEIGRLLDSIPATELDNTLIVYLGDNGTPKAVIDTSVYARSHGKGTLYEGGIGVPMVIAGHGVNRINERETALINTVDLYATVSDAAGKVIPEQIDGQSFYNLLSDSEAQTREYNYSEFVSSQTNGWTIRNDRLKLLEFSDGTQELYNLIDDPTESNNLVGQSANAAVDIANLKNIVATIRSDVDNATNAPVEITGINLVNSSDDCRDYESEFTSFASDINNNAVFMGELKIAVTDDVCVFTSNAIPNHDFNDADRSFPNTVSVQSDEYRIPVLPTLAAMATPLSLTFDNAILLNGVTVDILAAGCFGVGNGKVGCNDPDQPWRYDPMSPAAGFLVDSHNAHSQPDGTYHYHGQPNALFSLERESSVDTSTSPVVGFAADGFAVFGSYIQDGESVRKVRSSYRLKAGSRPSGNGQPGGTFDGTFRDDYEYVEGLGDLDECNGMTTDAGYRYHITESFPYVLGCFKGTPDESFRKGR